MHDCLHALEEFLDIVPRKSTEWEDAEFGKRYDGVTREMIADARESYIDEMKTILDKSHKKRSIFSFFSKRKS